MEKSELSFSWPNMFSIDLAWLWWFSEKWWFILVAWCLWMILACLVFDFWAYENSSCMMMMNTVAVLKPFTFSKNPAHVCCLLFVIWASWVCVAMWFPCCCLISTWWWSWMMKYCCCFEPYELCPENPHELHLVCCCLVAVWTLLECRAIVLILLETCVMNDEHMMLLLNPKFPKP